jgi:hypothetical protein
MTSIRTTTEGAPHMFSRTLRLPLLGCAFAAALVTTGATASVGSGGKHVAFAGRPICTTSARVSPPGCAPLPSPTFSVQ